MHPLEREIATKVILDRLIRDDETVIVVGVSGGPDSVGLLHLMLPLQKEIGVSLVAAYINHGLRPEESRDEALFVQSLCSKMSVPFECIEVNVRDLAKKKKISLEHAARDLRYRSFREIAARHKASLIAVGHTADDQAEEVLLRLIRGSARKGLSGMRTRSHNVIRPLLSVERGRILSYLDEKKIAYCIDSSNTDMRFTRNRVRHSLIPFLEKEFDKGIRRALCKTADSLAEDESFLEELTESALDKVFLKSGSETELSSLSAKLDRRKFSELPRALQRRVIEKLLWQLHCSASYTHIKKIVEAAEYGTTGTELHLSRGLRIGIQREYLEFLYPQGKTAWRGRLYVVR